MASGPTEEDGCKDTRTNPGAFSRLKNLLMRHRKLFTSTLSYSRNETVLAFCCILYLFFFAYIPVGAGIDCFKCDSYNGNNPACEDPFHNNFSVSILESPCMGWRKGRNGLFPATACLKLAGTFVNTGDRLIIRDCALDSGTLTTDTEIIRMSHCGHFYYNDSYVKGCLQSCDDSDGCNSSSRPSSWPLIALIAIHLIITPILLLLPTPRYYLTTVL